MESLTKRFDGEVFQPYLELLKSGYRFHRAFDHARQCWSQGLTHSEINGPFLERALTYAPGEALEELGLDARSAETIRKRLGGRGLYLHQTTALQLVLHNKNAIIATGTRAAKLCAIRFRFLMTLCATPRPVCAP